MGPLLSPLPTQPGSPPPRWPWCPGQPAWQMQGSEAQAGLAPTDTPWSLGLAGAWRQAGAAWQWRGGPPEKHPAGSAAGGPVEGVHLEAVVVGVGLVRLDVRPGGNQRGRSCTRQALSRRRGPRRHRLCPVGGRASGLAPCDARWAVTEGWCGSCVIRPRWHKETPGEGEDSGVAEGLGVGGTGTCQRADAYSSRPTSVASLSEVCYPQSMWCGNIDWKVLETILRFHNAPL